MSALLLLVGLGLGNLCSVYLFDVTWPRMFERTFFQAVALGASALVQLYVQ